MSGKRAVGVEDFAAEQRSKVGKCEDVGEEEGPVADGGGAA